MYSQSSVRLGCSALGLFFSCIQVWFAFICLCSYTFGSEADSFPTALAGFCICGIRMVHIGMLLSVPDVALTLSVFCGHDTVIALFGSGRREWASFSSSRGRYYHVVLWLSGRVRYIVEAYLLACQNVAWIDIDVEGEEEVEEAEDQLEVHRVACQSLYSTYASRVQIAASAEPWLSSSLGDLVFALEMVTESEVVFLRDADQFFWSY